MWAEPEAASRHPTAAARWRTHSGPWRRKSPYRRRLRPACYGGALHTLEHTNPPLSQLTAGRDAATGALLLAR